MKLLMLITGPVATRSGYGSHSRDLVRSLIAMDKFDIHINSLRWGNTPMNALKEKNPKEFKIGEFFAPKNKQRPNWRLTVDYLDDLNLIKKIYFKLYNPDSFIKYNDVFNFLENNPKLLEINKENS